MFTEDCNLLLKNVMEGVEQNKQNQKYPMRGKPFAFLQFYFFHSDPKHLQEGEMPSFTIHKKKEFLC